MSVMRLEFIAKDKNIKKHISDHFNVLFFETDINNLTNDIKLSICQYILSDEDEPQKLVF